MTVHTLSLIVVIREVQRIGTMTIPATDATDSHHDNISESGVNIDNVIQQSSNIYRTTCDPGQAETEASYEEESIWTQRLLL